MIDLVDYRYHAVGQGLFSTGALIRRGAVGPRFRWAFDCGTVSGQRLIVKAMDDLAWPNPDTLEFDLVAISHFDADHISGLAELLARFPVRTLMLPYAALAVRLALAFAQGVDPASPVFRCFIDPVGYIRSLDGGDRIERILLVPPSGDEGPPAEREGPERPLDPDDRDGREEREDAKRRIELYAETVGLDEAARGDLLLANDVPGDVGLAMLAPGGRLQVGDIWEFVPYNNAELAPANLAAFALAVAERRQALLDAAADWRARQGPPKPMRKAIRAKIDALKAFYDASFGAGPEARNLISLFLYSGPLPALRAREETIFYAPHFQFEFLEGEAPPIAQLSTGDGYLDTPQRLDALVRYLSVERVARVGVFQVMHHGAWPNWHKGVAARFAPLVSIFSSDPGRGGTYHPNAEVLRDFWPYGPVQVDKIRSLSITIYIR